MKTTFLLFAVFSYGILVAQDPVFSQASENLLYVNPAFTGTSENFRAGASYSNQWSNLSANFITTNVYVDQYFGKLGGLGMAYIHDIAGGTTVTDNIYLDYSNNIKINEKGVLSAGIEVGYLQKSLDWSSLTFGDMIDSRRGFVYTTSEVVKSKPKNIDLGAGFLFYNDVFFAGYSLHHINKPDVSFTNSEARLQQLQSVFLGGSVKTGKLIVSPQFDAKFQGGFTTFLGLAKINYKWLTLGAGIRHNANYVFYGGVNFKKFRINYSYDQYMTKLNIGSNNAHEISFQVFLNTLKTKNERALRIY